MRSMSSSTAGSFRQQYLLLIGFLLGWLSCAIFSAHGPTWQETYHRALDYPSFPRVPRAAAANHHRSANYGDFCNSTIIGERETWNQNKKVISFAVFGPFTNTTRNTDRKYLNVGNTLKWIKAGIHIQATTAQQYYPDWILRFYIAGDTLLTAQEEQDLIANYTNVELIYCQRIDSNSRMMMLRFLVNDDPTVKISLVRDVDSRFSLRELAAVNEWMAHESQYDFHVMRDHKNHQWPVMGGTLGMRRRCLGSKSMLSLMEQAFQEHPEKIDGGRVPGEDQAFMALYVWPLVKDRTLVHDSRKSKTNCGNGTVCKDFPLGPRSTSYFVGQEFKSDRFAKEPHLCFEEETTKR